MLTLKVVSKEHSGFWGKCMLFQSVKKRKSVRKKLRLVRAFWTGCTQLLSKFGLNIIIYIL